MGIEISDYSLSDHVKYVGQSHVSQESRVSVDSSIVKHAQTHAIEISHQDKFTELFSLDQRNAPRAEFEEFQGKRTPLFGRYDAYNNPIVNSSKLMEVKVESESQKAQQETLNTAFSEIHHFQRMNDYIKARMLSIVQG